MGKKIKWRKRKKAACAGRRQPDGFAGALSNATGIKSSCITSNSISGVFSFMHCKKDSQAFF